MNPEQTKNGNSYHFLKLDGSVSITTIEGEDPNVLNTSVEAPKLEIPNTLVQFERLDGLKTVPRPSIDTTNSNKE
jgi:hypothetical protein